MLSLFYWSLPRAALTSLTMALCFAACAPARVVTRDAEPWGCVADAQRMARSGESAPVVAWLSSASLERWIAAVDRIGQRAGVFAIGSSVRTRAQQDLVDALGKLGVHGVDWLDPTRPLHLIWQPVGEGKGGGAAQKDTRYLTLLVPSQGADRVESAAKKATIGRHPSAPGVVLRLEDEQAWLSHLNHYTQLLTMRAEQHGVAAAAANCLHNRRPEAMLTVGVAVAEIMRQRPGQVEEALSRARKEAGKRNTTAGFFDDWLDELRELVSATEAVEMSVSVDEQRGNLGMVLRPVADSSMARRLAATGQLPPNPLPARLPARSYLATASGWQGEDDAARSRKSMNMVLELMKVPEADRSVLLSAWQAMFQFSEPHSAAALFPAGQLAMAADALWSSKDGHAQLDAIARFGLEVAVQLLKASKREALAKGKTPEQVAGELDPLLTLARGSGWAGLFGELTRRSATWPVQLSSKSTTKDGLRCHVLDGRLDWVAIKRAMPAADMARAMLGDNLGVALCATKELGMFLLHPEPLTEARRVAGGTGGGLTETPLYRDAMKGRPNAQWFTLLDPGFLMDLARQVFDSLPKWPAGAAIVSTCSFDATAARCRLDLPLAIADMLAPLLGGFGR